MPYYDTVVDKEYSLLTLSRRQKFSGYATYRKDARMELVLIALRYLRSYISSGGKIRTMMRGRKMSFSRTNNLCFSRYEL